jgi:DNA modification methylase
MRALDELVKSIRDDEQLLPILVSKSKGDRYDLIAGERRTRACRKLGIGVKAIIKQPRDAADALWKQLVENVQRNDFTPLELGEGLRRYKELYQGLHPETKHGAVGRRGSGRGQKVSRKSDSDTSETAERYTKHVANEMGLSETAVKESIQLATELPPKRKAELRSIADPKKRQRAERQALSDLRKDRKAKRLQERAKDRAEEQGEAASRIDLGNCREILQQYAKEGLAFDLVLSDPPYGLHWSKIEHSCRASLNAEPTWDDLDVGWVLDVAPLLAPNSTVVVFTPAEAIGAYQEVFHEVGLKFRGSLFWWKTNPAPVHRPGNYISAVECIVWATKGRPFFREWPNAGTEDAHNAFRSPICQGEERLAHDTQKPLRVIERLLKQHAPDGGSVIDPFMGTGTTIVACKKLSLQSAGIEQDSKFFELAKARIMAL